MGRAKKDSPLFKPPSPERLEIWAKEMRDAGETPPSGTAEELRLWMRKQGERELWWFSRFILHNTYLSLGTFHRKIVCPYLTDFTSKRWKLLMLPMGCLKTTVASRSLPLHALIQPARHNIYFADKLGRNVRILLANENEQKSESNLRVCRDHLEQNPKLRWVWPECVWPDGKAPSGKRWKDNQLDIPRTIVAAEPSISAVGVKTGFIGSYYDIIVGDDLAALEAAQSPPLMERAKNWRKAAKTRFYDKQRGIFIGAATHWSMTDICVEWKADVSFEVMIRSIKERDESGKEVALWPEKYPLDWVEETRKSTDPINFSLWYMNQPVPTGFTAMKWSDLREFRSLITGDAEHPVEVVEFDEAPIDEMILERHQRISNNLMFRIGRPLIDTENLRPRAMPKRRPGDDSEDYADQTAFLRAKYPRVSMGEMPPDYPNKLPKEDDL